MCLGLYFLKEGGAVLERDFVPNQRYLSHSTGPGGGANTPIAPSENDLTPFWEAIWPPDRRSKGAVL